MGRRDGGLHVCVRCAFGFGSNVKVSLITAFPGLNADIGPVTEKAIKLYIQEHAKNLPPGVKAAGVELIGPGDITNDIQLDTMGVPALGVITAFHYSNASDRPANRYFVTAWHKAYGPKLRPNFIAVGAWDTIAATFYAIHARMGNSIPNGR